MVPPASVPIPTRTPPPVTRRISRLFRAAAQIRRSRNAGVRPVCRRVFPDAPGQRPDRIGTQQFDFHTVEDLKTYLADNPARTDEVLYQQLPDPAIPSNAAYDPLDSADP